MLNPDTIDLFNSRLVRYMRWLMIGLFSLSLVAFGVNWFIVLVLTLVAIVLNSLFDYYGKTHNLMYSVWYLVTTVFLFVATLVLYTGGVNSPFFALLFMYVVFASYFFSYRGALFSCLLANGLLLYLYSRTGIDFRDINIMFGLVATGILIAKISSDKIHQIEKIQKSASRIEHDDLQLSSVVNTISDAVFLLDKNGKILRYNGAALELVDTHEEFISKQFSQVLKLHDKNDQLIRPADLVLKHNKIFSSDDIYSVQGKNKISLYINVAPIQTGNRNRGAVVLARDISAQKTLEMQKDEFLSIISHELRTPVAIVEANLSTALLPGFVKMPVKATKLLRNAYDNLTYLSNLLQDLSSLTQADRSVIETEIKEIHVNTMMRELAHDFSDRAKKAGTPIKLKIDTKLPTISNSEGRIREILVNYLTNAIKYGVGGKQILVRVTPSDKVINGVKFSVQDFGLGIKLVDQQKLFGKFYRTEEVKQKNIQGTGMGLYISKKQAEKLGGEVWFESKPGHGSIFYLEVASVTKH